MLCFLPATEKSFNVCNMPSTSDVYITGHEVSILSKMSGQVIYVNSASAGLVRKGDILIHIDNTEAINRYKKAEKKQVETLKEIKKRYAKNDENNTSLIKAQMGYQQALNDYNRRIQSRSVSIISKKDLQQSLKAVNNSKVSLDIAIQKYRRNQRSLLASDITQQQIMLQVTEEFQAASLALQYTEIRSPVTGYVAQRNVATGINIASEQIVMTIVPVDQIWVTANFKATQLSDIFIGQKASISTDLYGSEVALEGKVEGFNLDTVPTLSALLYQNGANNWISDMQRVSVRISINPLQMAQYPLWPGLSSKVTLLYGSLRTTTLLTHKSNTPAPQGKSRSTGSDNIYCETPCNNEADDS